VNNNAKLILNDIHKPMLDLIRLIIAT